jgi:acetone carboxylase gamma subunit
MTDLDKHRVQQLIDGELTWDELRNEILPDPKDPDRFEKTREVIQERVDWDDPVLVPLNDHLYVVGTDSGRVIRARCGEDLCEADENWKKSCQVRVREEDEEFEELYPDYMHVAPDWSFELREWYCPNCYELVDVDTTPVGYPVIKPFDPDIDTFYEEWQGRPAPDRASDDQTAD